MYLNLKEETAFSLLQVQLKIKRRIGDSPIESTFHFLLTVFAQASYSPRGGGVLPYMGYIGMYRCEGYGFEAVYSRIGYINQSVWV